MKIVNGWYVETCDICERETFGFQDEASAKQDNDFHLRVDHPAPKPEPIKDTRTITERRRDATLARPCNWDGRYFRSRKLAVETFIAEGWTVRVDTNGRRRFWDPELYGFLAEEDITKTAMDYAVQETDGR